MSKTLLKNVHAIVTCDCDDTVYENCDVLIDSPRILQIGKGLEDDQAQVIDCTGKVIYPGLIGTHHHFFQTFVRNRMVIDYPSMTVMEWLDRVYPIFANVDEEIMYYSSLTAMADLVKHGCTTAFDHQYNHTKGHGVYMIDQQVRGAEQIGVRYVGGRSANTLPMEKGSPIPPEILETTEGFLEDCERLINKYHDREPYAMTQIVVAPCQPINSYPETFSEAAKLARKHGVRMHTHLGEGETAGMLERYGMRTLDWCEEQGFIGEDVWFAHCWELTVEEFEKLGKYNSGVSHCPSPAILGGFPIIDMKAIQETGTVISLGCDGSSTNDSSSLLDTLRTTYLMQAWHSKERGGSVSPYEILKMATVNGAKTLGRPELGWLGEGQAADLFAINIQKLEYVGATHDLLNFLPKVGVTGEVDFTMVNGAVIFKDGKLTRVIEEQLQEEATKAYAKISVLLDQI
ncbi:MAG: amidohydrolase [Eubacteriales bacterium]|nr:amidohydrolase [Eubacteriales bacterium]MDD4541540.1 amidohydrolase [Eubacteriales bacterium]